MDMKQLRQQAGLKAEDVAVTLGVARSTVGNWEQGKSVPHFNVIGPLLRLYKCTFDQLDQAVKESTQK